MPCSEPRGSVAVGIVARHAPVAEHRSLGHCITMNNKGRQLTVGAIGLVVASLGAFFRLAILDSRTHDFLATATSLGRFRTAGAPLGTSVLAAGWPATKTLEALGGMALGVF